MLEHLSEEPNRRALAVNQVARMFDRQGTKRRFPLVAAPVHRGSEIIEI